MPWIYLLIASVFEICFAMGLKSIATGLKHGNGFTLTLLWPTLGTVASTAISLWFLTNALRTIPVGTGYAVWTGIGAVGIATLGIIFFGDSASWPRLACIGLIISGVIGLKLMS